MPTGGVSVENADQWIRAGCVALGVGGELTKGAATTTRFRSELASCSPRFRTARGA